MLSLDRIGDAHLVDTGAEDNIRTLEAETYAPLDPPYAQAYFRYAEPPQLRTITSSAD